MKIRFIVTYEIVTPDSAESGEVEESGFITTDARLRDAIAEVKGTRTNEVESASIEDSGRWITIRNGMEFRTGAYESRSIHPSFNITKSSYSRLFRLIEKP